MANAGTSMQSPMMPPASGAIPPPSMGASPMSSAPMSSAPADINSSSSSSSIEIKSNNVWVVLKSILDKKDSNLQDFSVSNGDSTRKKTDSKVESNPKVDLKSSSSAKVVSHLKSLTNKN